MSRCPECVECEADHCFNSAYCLADPRGSTRPCPHDRVLCGEHLDECPECVAEMEAVLAGDLLPPARTLADVLAEQRAHLDARAAASGFDPITNRPRTPNTGGGNSYG